MNKLFLLVVFLFVLYPLAAQEILYEVIEGDTNLKVLIPYKQIIFPAEAIQTHYNFTIQITNYKNKVVYHKQMDSHIPKNNHLLDSALVLEFKARLLPDEYRVKTKLINMVLGDAKENIFNIKIPAKDTAIGELLVFSTFHDIEFIPPTLQNLPSRGINLRLRTAVPADSIVLKISSDSLDMRKKLNTAKYLYIALDSLLQGSTVYNLELHLFKDNVVRKIKPLLFNKWYYYKTKYTYEEQLQQIRYIASQNEWKILKNVPAERMEMAIEDYWSKHEPSPATLQNETRDLFYERVLESDELFTIHKRLVGWKSDRGRIFIRFGPPDEINSEVLPLGHYPVIEWHYYKLNKVFYFLDKTGFGNYTLWNKSDEN